jgi:hypothetical protein
MVTSLSELCARVNVVTSLVVEVDRRQVTDRRGTRRGGRRADDANPAFDPLDMRSIAIRRATVNSHLPSVSLDQTTHADAAYVVTARSIDPAARGLATAAGRRPE